MTDAKTLCRAQMRRQAMLDAATELFLEKGFAGTSLSDIVSRSKGSRSTLYELFGNKEGLLRAMVEEVTASVWAVIGTDDTPLCEEAGLIELAQRFVDAALAPQTVALYRILVAEGARMPEIAHLFFERGPRSLHRLLAARFEPMLKQRGLSGSGERIAQLFLGAVLGHFHLVWVLDLSPRPTTEDIDAHIRLAVRLFLSSIGHPQGTAA